MLRAVRPLLTDAPKAGPQQVLLVDDDEFVRNVLLRQLAALGLGDAAAAANGHDALQALKSGRRFGLIICDLVMPGMDGIEFLRHLAATVPGAAVLLVSGQDPKLVRGAEELARAHGLQLLGSVPKPVSTAQLRSVLARNREAPGRVMPPAEPIDADELRAAIEQGAIEAHVQPKVSTADRSLAGVEVLARWPRGGRYVPPDQFIPAAERHGLIDDLTDLVARRALESCGQWAQQGVRTRVSINVSADSLPRIDLPEVLGGYASAFGVDPRQVIVEITESSLAHDEAHALDVLMRLRLRGMGLSLDDFGTGWSSLKQLKRMPFSELKIDHGFVSQMHDDPESARIVESSVRLARDLSLDVVAEGVETPAQLERLAQLRCGMVQGYLIARPMPSADLPKWLREQRLS